jgi:dihydroorotase
MTIDINIRNGRLFLPSGEFKEGGIAINNGVIVKIGKEPNLPRASKIINASGGLILPGLIDLHVHFRDFQQRYKETLETGCRAAVAGGVTTVIDMPNNKPPTDSAYRIKLKKKKITEKAAANIGFYCLLPTEEKEIKKIVKEGIFGFKIYPDSPLYPPKNNQLLFKQIKKISEYNLPLLLHADNAFAKEREEELLAKNDNPIEAFLKAHNQLDEAKAVETFLDIIRKAEGHLHCVHVTAKEVVEILEKNQNKNYLTGECCPHHLLLNEKTLKEMKGQAKCLPPLRTVQDQKALWRALNEGVISIITTDHAPHSLREKSCEFEGAAAGISGIETLLPVMLTSAFQGRTPLKVAIEALTSNPAKFMQIEKRGELKEGYYADITIVEKEKWKIKGEDFESKAKWTPFEGFESLVYPSKVIVNGQLSKDGEHILSKARSGTILKRDINEIKNEDE